jgi:hypothetical protein
MVPGAVGRGLQAALRQACPEQSRRAQGARLVGGQGLVSSRRHAPAAAGGMWLVFD